MNVDLIFRIAAIGIIVAVLNQVLIRSGREEQAMMTTLAGLVVVLMMVIEQISVLFDTVKALFGPQCGGRGAHRPAAAVPAGICAGGIGGLLGADFCGGAFGACPRPLRAFRVARFPFGAGGVYGCFV